MTWGRTEEAKSEAEKIELWHFRDALNEIAEAAKGQAGYFGDDTLRTIVLYVKASQGVG